ncbi:hypothetical protein NQD34_018200 [Periophthalmus magnuspinnatus]|uniref:polymeric immunoglobulin receptor-like n=1 Tax=Periophthalmus magnuspinnatus TaxID=409849 RepID=UPI0022C399AD|nr:polymeric immunoglobulin receptor-like isoform X2 [Periophthalmus magnuspinnatus]XP_055088468.1 polymeric immunoglobulin receptor-like [Periophthalmus magnuspinnatus]KAI9999444.1 hypothetical protein NQD34_018200 [Periophthalmus magnuspinnatus]
MNYTCDTLYAPYAKYTISDVRALDKGVYWCGNRSLSEGHRVSRQKILLQVFAEIIDVPGCSGGWVEFIWPYKGMYTEHTVSTPTHEICSNVDDQWEQVGPYCLYHDTTGRYLKMMVRQIQKEDFGSYYCRFDETPAKLFNLSSYHSYCRHQYTQTTSKAKQTTIVCKDLEREFICKESEYNCDTVPAHQSQYTISNVGEEDEGVYWCVCKVQARGFRVTKQKILLQVKNEPLAKPVEKAKI